MKPDSITVLLNSLLATLNARESLRDQISRDGVQIPLSSGTMSGESRNARTFDAERLTVRQSLLGILLVSLWLFRVSTTLLILGTRRCMTAREFLWPNRSEPSLPETACYRARVATFCNLFRVFTDTVGRSYTGYNGTLMLQDTAPIVPDSSAKQSS